MATAINRTLKDLRYLITAEDWEDGESIAHGGLTQRFERLEAHGWVENQRDGWMEDNPCPEKRRAAPVTIVDLTDQGRQLREQHSLEDIRNASTLGDVLDD